MEWPDNSDVERFGADDQPGSWEPWTLCVGGIRARVIALIALRVVIGRRRSTASGVSA